MLPTIQLPRISTGPFVYGDNRDERPYSSLDAPADWRERIPLIYNQYLWYKFSQPHNELWQWAASIDIDSAPPPFIALWSRNRGKSTHAEIVVADLGARQKRRYCMYVSETQAQADKHVATIARILESDNVAEYYPEVSQPRLGRNGSRTWNRQMLTADNGLTVEAVGLDKAVRGHKIDWSRPDLIIFDDIDGKHDTQKATNKKEATTTASIIQAGAENCAVLFVQNLIHDDSIAHRLSKNPNEPGGADYLTNRIISGPYPAVEGLAYEFVQQDDGSYRWKITGGKSLWEGFTIKVCENELNSSGPTSYEIESQHEIDTDDPNALLTTDQINATRVSSHPDLYRIGIGVDPSGGAGQCGIVAGGLAKLGRETHGFTIADNSTPMGTSSLDWAVAVLRTYYSLGADVIFVERNFGGDMAANTIRTAVLRNEQGHVILEGKHVKIVEVNASRGKAVRAEPVATLFELGKMHHVGYFPELQKEWTRWIPGEGDSPNRLDAEVWMCTGLGLVESADKKTASIL
jgi:hypothetical protein